MEEMRDSNEPKLNSLNIMDALKTLNYMILTIRNGLIFIDMHSEDTSEGIFVGDVTNASTLSAAFDGVT